MTSLLGLPDELLYSILSLAQIPPCKEFSLKECTISPLLQVSRRFRHVAFDLFTRTHTVLSLRPLKDRYLNSLPDNPIDNFLDDVSRHLVEVPCHWKSIHPYKPAVLRIDINLGTTLKEFFYLLERRERDFICTTHGLTSLLHLYHKSAYSQLKLSLEVVDKSPKSQLFCTILEWFQVSLDTPTSDCTGTAAPETCSDSSVLRKSDKRELGRPLLDGQADKFVDMFKHTLKLTRSYVHKDDFESAISVVLHFGLPLLNQLPSAAPRWLPTNASRAVFPQIALDNWKTNTNLALMFQITQLATHVLCCAYLAYCISIQEGGHNWAQAHPMVVEQHYLIENFGMSAKEVAEFDFVVVLQWIYECKTKDYTTGPQDLSVQLLKQLRDAYQAGGYQKIHARVYEHVVASLSINSDEQMLMQDGCRTTDQIEYLDIDGMVQNWNGSLEDWKSWQIPLRDGHSEPRSRYLFRAQELFHQGESFEDLHMAFFQKFCETGSKKH